MNGTKTFNKPERLWYNVYMKGGYKMKCVDIDEMIYGDDFDKHSTK